MNDSIITFLASFLIWLMFAGLLALWIVDGKIKKEQALHALIASLFAWMISQMIKGLFPSVRPFEVNGGGVKTITMPLDGSFPSGHTAAAFALAITVWLHDKKMGAIYIVAALLVGIGRITANVHYPVDIVAGGILGTITGYGVEKLHVFKLIRKKK